jgi:predicted naringenin-chalcone synthase
MMNLTLVGYGTALPEHSITMEESVQSVKDYFAEDEQQARKLDILYRMTRVKRRHSVLLDGPEGTEERMSFFPRPDGSDCRGPTVQERMARYEHEALPLARRAALKALAQSGLAPAAVTHLITVSCSGFAAPGVDVGLIRDLGLRQTTERAHIGFMGCHGAMNGLRVARAFVESNPDAVVLLCAVELCSLHYQYGWDPDLIVANALFADGAAALVCTATDGAAEDAHHSAWRARDTGSCLVPDSEDAMTWRIGDHGFIMSLSARVPQLIATHLRGWIEAWLCDNGLALTDVRTWAVHPGGPRILGSVARALDLTRDDLGVSYEVLAECGNMSSPTILFILTRLRECDAARPCVALGFGPGLSAEATLWV